jgi:hypothetical protein
MANGQMYDLLAIGMIDKQLTGNPVSTFWRHKWSRHTRFSLESVSQPFNTSTAFGQESQLLVNRTGDLLYFLYLHCKLPGLVACDASQEQCAGVATGGQFPVYMNNGNACSPCEASDQAALLEYLPSNYNELPDHDREAALKEAKDLWRREKYGAGTALECCTEADSDCPGNVCPELGENWCHYCNDVGHFMINKAKLVIGGQQVDQLWGTFLFAWEELTGKSGRRLLELTGRRWTRAQLVCDSREERELYIPLPFYFTLASGSALPLASLAYHGVSINIEFERLEKLIVVSKSDVVVRNAKTGLGVTGNDLHAALELGNVFLDQQERDKFSSSHFEQLIVQTQAYFHTDNKQTCRIGLAFNHPTLELIFMVRRQCQEQCNNWSNFSGVDGRDPILAADLLLNTSSRFGKKPALFWRGVVPFQHHSNLPEAFVYVMSFALNPEPSGSLEPCGSCNLSRIDNIELVLDMQSALVNQPYTVYVFSRSWNLMRFREGVAGAAFQ